MAIRGEIVLEGVSWDVQDGVGLDGSPLKVMRFMDKSGLMVIIPLGKDNAGKSVPDQLAAKLRGVEIVSAIPAGLPGLGG